MKELSVKFNVLMAKSDNAQCCIDADKLLIQSLESLVELCDNNIKEHEDEKSLKLTFMMLKDKTLNTIIDRNMQLQSSIERQIELLGKLKELEILMANSKEIEVVH